MNLDFLMIIMVMMIVLMMVLMVMMMLQSVCPEGSGEPGFSDDQHGLDYGFDGYDDAPICLPRGFG